jgi:hypothetical protein
LYYCSAKCWHKAEDVGFHCCCPSRLNGSPKQSHYVERHRHRILPHGIPENPQRMHWSPSQPLLGGRGVQKRVYFLHLLFFSTMATVC